MFDKIFAMVTSMFGVASLPKNTEGKSVLTAEMEQQITEKWGAKFLESFKNDLAAAEANGNDPSINADVVALQKQLNDIKSQLTNAMGKNATLESEKKDLEAKVQKLSLEAEVDKPEEIEMKQGEKRTAFKPNMAYMHNKVIDNYFNGDGAMQYSTDTTIDTAELQQEFGKYISSEKIEILRRLTSGLTCTQHMTTVVTDKTEWRASQAIIDSVLQQFVPYWTPSKKAKFTPITIKNFFLKVNQPIKPADIIDQYFGYLYDEGLTPDQMPIVRYIVEDLVMPKLYEDLEFAMAQGKFVEFAPTQDGQAAPADAAQAAMDGYITALKKLKATAGNTVTWLLDGVTLTHDNIMAEMDKVVMSIKPQYRYKKMSIHADPDLILMYQQAYLDKYKNRITEDEVKLKLNFSQFTFVPMEGMIGTGAFFITPKENFKHLMSRNVNEAKIYMQVQNYDVKVFMEFRKGTGFAMQEAIFAYLPEGDAPEASTGSGL